MDLWKEKAKTDLIVKTWKMVLESGDQGEYQQWCHIDSVYIWYEVMKIVLYPCDFPPQIIQPQPNYEGIELN
jgi:hypothetical protein